MVAKIIKLTYYTKMPHEKLYTLEQIAEFARRYDWPNVQWIASLADAPGYKLSDAQRLSIERMLEIDQDKLDLKEFGESFEISLEES